MNDDVINNPAHLQKLILTIDQAKVECLMAFHHFIAELEQSKNSGAIEPENYQQLTSDGLFGGAFKSNFHTLFNEKEVPDMINCLDNLKRKLEEYLNLI